MAYFICEEDECLGHLKSVEVDDRSEWMEETLVCEDCETVYIHNT